MPKQHPRSAYVAATIRFDLRATRTHPVPPFHPGLFFFFKFRQLRPKVFYNRSGCQIPAMHPDSVVVVAAAANVLAIFIQRWLVRYPKCSRTEVRTYLHTSQLG